MNDTFLRACKGEKTDYTPVWIMRQAGRYLPQYRMIRADMDFLTLCKTPEKAAEVTMQPVNILSVDAAILFSDILIPAEKMGLKLRFLENKGPRFGSPVRTINDVKKLRVITPDEDVPYVLETIKILRNELKVPLIGFAGAPYTLATYMIEGGSSKNFLTTKKLMYAEPEIYTSLMEKVTETTIAYLSAQVHAGAQAVQLFDSWAGSLSPSDYKTYAFPYAARVVKALKQTGVPVIYFVNDCAGIVDLASGAGSDVLGVCWRIDLKKAVSTLKGRASVQGNMDPCLLYSPKSLIEKEAAKILKKGASARGHIFNLGHGILPDTPVDNVKFLVDTVHQKSTWKQQA
ncbi:MAG: uroporphyrinogen decarboxylase [Nitrospirae bacterium]|nr:uroporphyrinogen decarboxylase [Nitrospirota bacterium]